MKIVVLYTLCGAPKARARKFETLWVQFTRVFTSSPQPQTPHNLSVYESNWLDFLIFDPLLLLIPPQTKRPRSKRQTKRRPTSPAGVRKAMIFSWKHPDSRFVDTSWKTKCKWVVQQPQFNPETSKRTPTEHTMSCSLSSDSTNRPTSTLVMIYTAKSTARCCVHPAVQLTT